jgi:hypothetical protein
MAARWNLISKQFTVDETPANHFANILHTVAVAADTIAG